MEISQATGEITVSMPTTEKIVDRLKYRQQVRKLQELEVSCEDYKTQVTCLLEEIDEQKQLYSDLVTKIGTLEKLLKLYL